MVGVDDEATGKPIGIRFSVDRRRPRPLEKRRDEERAARRESLNVDVMGVKRLVLTVDNEGDNINFGPCGLGRCKVRGSG